MKIDLHIHTKTGSDGKFSVEEVFNEADSRSIELISITDHDSIECQETAAALAKKYNIRYISGVELNITFQLLEHKAISLDFLGYNFDLSNTELKNKLQIIKDYRENRAKQILENINIEFDKEGIERFTDVDLQKIQETVDGAFGRPHIADYLVKKGIVSDRQEAFDKYLVKCDVPKYSLSLADASTLIRNAGGILVFAHPNDPNGTSLVKITSDLEEQARIIREYILEYIDGIECWHTRHDEKTTNFFIGFCKDNDLVITGGSDCHQSPILMGSLDLPDEIALQFQT